MTRDERQLINVNRWFNSDRFGSQYKCWGTIQAPPGYGKTTVGTNCIKEWFELIYNTITDIDERDFVVLVTTTLKDVIEKWQEKGKQMLPVDMYNKVTYMTVQSLHSNWPHRVLRAGLVIIDEIHLLYRTSEMSEIYYKYGDGSYLLTRSKLGLTATPLYTDNRGSNILSKLPIIDVVTKQEAEKAGWISIRHIFNVPVDLTDTETAVLMDVETRMAKFSAYLGKEPIKTSTSICRGTSEKGKYYAGPVIANWWASKNGWTKELGDEHQWSPNMITGYAKNYLDAVRERDALLTGGEDKCNTAVGIAVTMVERFADQVIIFCKRTITCDLIAAKLRAYGVPAQPIHSNVESAPIFKDNGYILNKGGKFKGQPKIFSGKKHCEIALNEFNAGKLKAITCVGAVSTGTDFTPKATVAIKLHQAGGINAFEQHTGRIQRVDPELEKISLVFNIYYHSTSDELNLIKVLRGIGDGYVKVPKDPEIIVNILTDNNSIEL